MTVLRMQPASVAAAALVTNGAADERNFLNITSQSVPKPVVVERGLSPPTTATAVPWVPPSTVNKMCADIGPALSEDAVSELLGAANAPPDGTATRREPAPSRSMQRQRREELERINARINQATDAWDDAIRPPEKWDGGHVPEDAEEIQKEIQLLLAGQRKRGSARRDMLEPVADASHQMNQLKQLQQIERESLEEQGESDGGAANVDAAVAVIRMCKERLSALHEKEKELLITMQSSMGMLGAELLELRGNSALDEERQREAEAALKEARELAASLQDQIELRDKASARGGAREGAGVAAVCPQAQDGRLGQHGRDARPDPCADGRREYGGAARAGGESSARGAARSLGGAARARTGARGGGGGGRRGADAPGGAPRLARSGGRARARHGHPGPLRVPSGAARGRLTLSCPLSCIILLNHTE